MIAILRPLICPKSFQRTAGGDVPVGVA